MSTPPADTIFALSSGQPPAGIAVIRVSGPGAGTALVRLAGGLPKPRRATFRRFRDEEGAALDDGLALWFPGPASATGEDIAELHLHGGRAVVAAMLAALGRIEGLRPALAGEFTRRAFENGRIDLSEAEGLSDLLAAETETQRRAALALAEGALGAAVSRWQNNILEASATIEAQLDFSDEGDVGGGGADVSERLTLVTDDIESMLAAPPAERLKDGVRVVLAGPPNAGKSSLFNVLAGRHAAIVSDIAGTTRDRIEAPVVIDDIAFLLIDTAGLNENSTDQVEAIGIALTAEALAQADIILWLGAPAEAPSGALLVAAKADLGAGLPGLPVSVATGEGISALRTSIVAEARELLPAADALSLNVRHRGLLRDVATELALARGADDDLVIAEHLRLARNHLDAVTGKANTERMLDTLFKGFCIGK